MILGAAGRTAGDEAGPFAVEYAEDRVVGAMIAGKTISPAKLMRVNSVKPWF